MEVYKKIIRQLHLWLGFASGLVVFVIAITGAILVFESDIKDFFSKKKSESFDNRSNMPSLSTGLQVVLDSLNKHPRQKEINKQFSYLFIDDKGLIGFDFNWKDSLNENLVTFLANPISNKIEKIYGLEKETQNESNIDNFFEIILGLHMHLLIDYNGIGREIVRWCTLVFFIMVLSGIILWWPKNKSAAQQRFWFRWKKNVRWKRMNYDLHNVLGFYACWIIIFAIITGLIFTFEYIDKGIYYAASGGKSINEMQIKPTIHSNEVQLLEPNLLDKIFNTVLVESKEKYYSENGKMISPTISMEVNNRINNSPIEVILQEPRGYENTWYWKGRSKVIQEIFQVDRATGAILHKNRFQIENLGDFINHNSGAIHFGSIFGWPSKILMLFGCLIAASLPITGFYIWYGRRKKANSNSNHIT
ncbi:MAG: PepSY domain-containing protein [Chloroflexia bacterium]|nr:PepSY domain-containing protein [Chloroflexia bacterium]